MPMTAFEIAWKYHTLSRCVIPSGGGPKRKSALVKWTRYQTERPSDEQLQEWESELAPAIWAMPTGPVSGLFVIDCDSADSVAMMEAARLKPHVRTPRGGAHFYCRWPGFDVPSKAGILPGIDVRGHGGYVNFAGTNAHGPYRVLIFPADNTLHAFEELPRRVQEALRPPAKTLTDRIFEQAIDRAQPGTRNDTCFWLCCQLRDNRVPQAEAEGIVRRYAGAVTVMGSQAYTEDEALASLGQAYSAPAREPWHTERSTTTGDKHLFNLTDYGNAERLVHHSGDNLRYCYERRRWLVWNGKVWEWDSGAQVTALAKMAVRAIYREAADEPSDERRRALVSHARKSESNPSLCAMIDLARSEQGISVTPSQLNADKWLLNCLNGTLDLRTGTLRPHESKMLITLIAPVRFDPGATCPLWDAHMRKVTGGDEPLIAYQQRVFGQCLTAETKQQEVYFVHGGGNNGKSTTLGTIRKLMGDYAGSIDIETLLSKERSSSNTREQLADLIGKRLVLSSEVKKGMKLNINLIKDMSGGEEIRGDRKYEHTVAFLPTHKLILFGNHKPRVNDNTLSAWRRLKLIPYVVTIPEKDIDVNLPSKLEGEFSGILNWLVAGCLDWQREGMLPPEPVKAATDNYRREQDALLDFFRDCCKFGPSREVPKETLREAYMQWCADNGFEPVSKTEFKDRLIEEGVSEKKSGSVRSWRGITLTTPAHVQNGTHGTDGTLFSRNSHIEKLEKTLENRVPSVPSVPKPDPLPLSPETSGTESLAHDPSPNDQEGVIL
ncbi:MAG: hypothetical protein FJZ95_04725, partial [Chloroflexi bacterium]|nr:hypothetical protein [Chloroflexota bacterium]